MNAALVARLRTIDWLLLYVGHFNRAMLMDYFGLSTPQVSMDIREYIRLAPNNIVYDKSARCYRRAPSFQRMWP